MFCPSSTCAGPVFITARSGGGATTLVVTDDVSSVGVRSVGTVAVFFTSPTANGVTTTCTAELVAPAANVPTLQLNEVTTAFTTVVVHTVAEPAAGVTDTNFVPAGTTSVNV